MPDEYARQPTFFPGVATDSGNTSSDTAATATANDKADANVPDFPHPAYHRMEPRWQLCRALMAGTEAIRDGRETYLPRLAAEDDDSYDFRLELVAVFPGFARTVKASVGLINQTPPMLGDDMPQQLIDLAENIDRQGTNLTVFAKTLTRDGIVDGLAGIFVDFTRADDPSLDRSKASAAAVPGTTLSSDDEKRLGMGPYWILVRADDVIKAIYRTINGVRTLILLVIRETSEELVGAFGLTTTTRYRVYRRADDGTITYELWEKAWGAALSTQTKKPEPLRNLKAIPWAPFIAGEEISPVEVRPPLVDLAYLNIEHHQVKTNLRNLETLAMVPTQVRIGAVPDKDGNYPPITLGPRSTIEAPLLDGGVQKPVYWHSPDVTVLDPGNRTLQDIKADMGSAGLAFLAPDTRVAETAAAKRIDSTAQNATIITVAGKLEDCLELAFQFTAQYLQLTSGSVTVNTDYESSVMQPQMVAALGQLAIAGKLDIETLLDLLEGGHVLPNGTDKDAILKRILTENALPPEPQSSTPPNGDPNADPNADTNANADPNADPARQGA